VRRGTLAGTRSSTTTETASGASTQSSRGKHVRRVFKSRRGLLKARIIQSTSTIYSWRSLIKTVRILVFRLIKLWYIEFVRVLVEAMIALVQGIKVLVAAGRL
jgi:hypothetical protein